MRKFTCFREFIVCVCIVMDVLCFAPFVIWLTSTELGSFALNARFQINKHESIIYVKHLGEQACAHPHSGSLSSPNKHTHTQQLTSVHIITKQESNALWNICIDKNCASSWNEPVKSYRTQCIRLHCFEPLELISQLFLPDSSLRYLWWWHYFTSLLRSTFSKDSI